jgi:tripartite-type tricarboxylate transporter receptor subunit TctC
MIKRSKIVAGLAVVTFLLAGSLLALAGEWKPNRTINIVVTAGAGGMTDSVSRAMAKGMEKALGTNISVVNMPGGSGRIATEYVMQQPRDGYNILGMSSDLHALPVLSNFRLTSKDFECCVVMSAKGVISVTMDSPYKTIQELIEAAKTKELKAAASQAGSIWGVKLVGFMDITETKFTKISYEGSAPSQVAALTGEVDVVLTGLSEQRDYILGKKLRPLAMVELDAVELDGYGRIPALAESYPAMKEMILPMQWVGLAFSIDMPKEITEAYYKAFAAALESPEIRKLSETLGVPVVGLYGDEGRKLLTKLDSVTAWALYESRVTTTDPSTIGIPRP